MGEVKDTIKGQGLKPAPIVGKAKIKGDNLIEMLDSLADAVSRLAQIKQDDITKEGKENEAENTRKATILKVVHTQTISSRNLLEDY